MEIIKEPSELLHQKSEEVSLPLSAKDKALLDEMYTWLKEHNDLAAGLSAVQVGVLKRMCVIKTTVDKNTFNYKLVNPKIISKSQKKAYLPEGCLSVEEEHQELVGRYNTIMIVGYDAIQNKTITIKTSGWLARVIQHEIDHMDGILFTDRIQKEA